MRLACPACPTWLQPLEPRSAWLPRALEHAEAMGIQVPIHGPEVLRWAALIAHAMVMHDELDLGQYLEAFIRP